MSIRVQVHPGRVLVFQTNADNSHAADAGRKQQQQGESAAAVEALSFSYDISTLGAAVTSETTGDQGGVRGAASQSESTTTTKTDVAIEPSLPPPVDNLAEKPQKRRPLEVTSVEALESPSDVVPTISVDALVGTTRLHAGHYLLVVVESLQVGKLQDASIYQVRKTMAIALASYETALASLERINTVLQQLQHAHSRKKGGDTSTENSEDEEALPNRSQMLEVATNEAEEEDVGGAKTSASPEKQHPEGSHSRQPSGTVEVSFFTRAFSPLVTIAGDMAANAALPRWNIASKAPAEDASPEFVQDRRILREWMSLLSTGTFFYSRDFDLTNTCQRAINFQGSKLNFSMLDERFWWNRHLLQAFATLERREAWAVHLIQGRVQVHKCAIAGHAFQFALLSRRSCRRAGIGSYIHTWADRIARPLGVGFRYQRRGVDSAGDVANFVETEQIVHINDPVGLHTLSFVQTRGSIPLYWSQPSQQRKPVPKLERTAEENTQALSTHLQLQKNKYGMQVLVSLVESSGRESIVGKAYQEYVQRLACEEVKFIPFDIHQECRGMRYEHISRLIDSLERDLTNSGYFWTGPRGLFSLQNGTIRTNCMDCLDRTNVVQCAIARSVINLQLLRLGVHSYPDKGLKYFVDFEVLFNKAWANNGDAISMAYTNTVAMKGDVTRTGKRNLQGVINDGAASLMRLYHNNFRDGFRQKIVDLMLGNTSIDSETLRDTSVEGNADKQEYDMDAVIKEQQDAIETSKLVALSAEEAKNALGWVGLNLEPSMMRLRGVVPVEKTFLLTSEAYYICVYDYLLEKVTQYKRVPLKNITQIRKGTSFATIQMQRLLLVGTYFMDKSETEPEANYAFIIYYKAENEEHRVTGAALNTNEFIKSMIKGNASSSSNPERSDIFKIRSVTSDSSRSIVEQLVARIVTAYFQLELDHSLLAKTFVVDTPLNPVIDRGSHLLNKMGDYLRPFRERTRKTTATSEDSDHTKI